MRVAFLAPTNQGQMSFYDLVADLMRVAAQQLDIEFDIVEGTHERNILIKRGHEIAACVRRPDYVVLANSQGAAAELLPVFEKAGIRTLLVIEGAGGSIQPARAHKGRATYLGEIVPDDLEAGRLLADVLVTEARRRRLTHTDGKMHVGIVTARQTAVDSLRFRGWQKFRDANPDIVQSGFQYGGWDWDGACVAIEKLITAAPDTSVIWCFNDTLAVRAVSAVAAKGLKPGKDILIGGIDLLEGALAAIVDGTIHVSLGGHLVDGVRALLLLQQHHEKGDLVPATRATRLEAVTAKEAARYLRFMKQQAWRGADFTRFSALRNPSPSRPELSLAALLSG
jgi:ABC-type sugar transport system substrate-binding protein